MRNTRALGILAAALAAFFAVGCGDVTAFDTEPDAGAGGAGIGTGGAVAGVGGAIGTGGHAGTGGAAVTGTGAALGTGGAVSTSGAGGAGGTTYPACPPSGTPAHLDECGNGPGQPVRMLNGLGCEICNDPAAPVGYSGYLTTVLPCVAVDLGLLCVADCNDCQ
jgi:hypothetical protein